MSRRSKLSDRLPSFPSSDKPVLDICVPADSPEGRMADGFFAAEGNNSNLNSNLFSFPPMDAADAADVTVNAPEETVLVRPLCPPPPPDIVKELKHFETRRKNERRAIQLLATSLVERINAGADRLEEFYASQIRPNLAALAPERNNEVELTADQILQIRNLQTELQNKKASLEDRETAINAQALQLKTEATKLQKEQNDHNVEYQNAMSNTETLHARVAQLEKQLSETDGLKEAHKKNVVDEYERQLQSETRRLNEKWEGEMLKQKKEFQETLRKELARQASEIEKKFEEIIRGLVQQFQT